MSVDRTEGSKLDDSDDETDNFLEGIEPAEILSTARERVTHLVTQHPVASLLGAFAIGFAIARVVRAIGEED